jgi:hypothetical protein
MRNRRYVTMQVKQPGGQGFDVVAVRRNANGQIVDFRIVETKTHRGKGLAALKETNSGRQGSRQWIADRLRAMRNSGDPRTRELAHELSRFRRASGRDWGHFVEVHDINTRSGKLTVRNPTIRRVHAEQSLDRVLRGVQTRGGSKAQRWATASLASWDRIRAQNMSTWLGKGTNVRRALSRSSRGLAARTVRQSATRGLARIARVAGPIGAVVATAMDAHKVYAIITGYRSGTLSWRDMVTGLTRTGGGIAGAAGGAALGAWIGAFGGPVAWLTIPIGAGMGGTIGYVGGAWAGETATDVWFGRIDTKVRAAVDQWILCTPARVVVHQ